MLQICTSIATYQIGEGTSLLFLERREFVIFKDVGGRSDNFFSIGLSLEVLLEMRWYQISVIRTLWIILI